MGIPILNELNQETDRLFIAGSRFSRGDARIKKYIAPLEKMGEKAPVFLKLSEQLSELVECAPEESAKKLIEIKSLLLAVLNTQGDMGTIGEISPLDSNYTDINKTAITYMELAPVLETLRNSGSNRLEILQQAHKDGILNDLRAIKSTVDALGGGNYDLTNYLIETVIPSMDTMACDYLYSDFKIDGKSTDANKLKAIYKLQNNQALDFIEECSKKGSDQIKAAAIEILSNHPEYEDLLLSLLHEKKLIKEAAISGLAGMDAKKGIDTLIEMFDSKSSRDEKLVQNALSHNEGMYLTQQLALLAESRYEKAKNNPDNKEAVIKLQTVLDTLHFKKSENIADLMKKILTERVFDGLSEIFSKEELASLGNIYNKSLSILYQTTFGNDFIWELFINSRQGLVDKILKKKMKAIAESLPLYAFYVGINKLDEEEYFDMFFKTGLYSNICKINRNAFGVVLQYAKDNKKTFSVKLVDYLITKKEFNNAISIVNIDDKKSISAILCHFKNNMDKNIYSYENYMILEFAGKNKLPEFNEMYELYCSQRHGSKRDQELLHKYLQN